LPFLIGLLLLGLVIALVGFWRVGASYSAQRSVQVGSVSPESGDDVLSAMWRAWTNSSLPSGGFVVDEENRTVRANISTEFNVDLSGQGFMPMGFTISGGSNTQTRFERFYPGEPECDPETDICDE
jgi:hypothetical protein